MIIRSQRSTEIPRISNLGHLAKSANLLDIIRNGDGHVVGVPGINEMVRISSASKLSSFSVNNESFPSLDLGKPEKPLVDGNVLHSPVHEDGDGGDGFVFMAGSNDSSDEKECWELEAGS